MVAVDVGYQFQTFVFINYFGTVFDRTAFGRQILAVVNGQAPVARQFGGQ